MTDQPVRQLLECPECGSSANLATIDRLEGYAHTLTIARGPAGLTVEWAGQTDVQWDTAVTVGVRCLVCLWESRDEHWSLDLHRAEPPTSNPRSDGGDVVACYLCWPHDDADCTCQFCGRSGKVPNTEQTRALLAAVQGQLTAAEAEEMIGRPVWCERCRRLVPELADEAAALCADCDTYNAGRVVL